jgi:hypothetical protein
LGIFIDCEDLAAGAEEMNEVAAVAASGVEDGHAGFDVAAQDLIEEVNVDLAELLLKGHGHAGYSFGSSDFSMNRRG